MHVQHDASAPAGAFGKANRLGVPQLDQRELGGDEESIQGNQQECRDDVGNVGEHCSEWGGGC